MPLLSLDPVPILETTDSGLLLFRDNVQLNYNKIQDIVNKLDSINIKDGSISTVDIQDSSITLVKISSEAWTSYTPSLTADTTNPTLGAGSSVMGRYVRIGRTIIGKANVTFGSSGTNAGSGFYSLSAPVAPAANSDGFTAVVGSGYAYNGALFHITVFQDNGVQSFRMGVASGIIAGNTTPFAWGVNNQIRLNFVYEAAS
jgi:hypothetical protein